MRKTGEKARVLFLINETESKTIIESKEGHVSKLEFISGINPPGDSVACFVSLFNHPYIFKYRLDFAKKDTLDFAKRIFEMSQSKLSHIDSPTVEEYVGGKNISLFEFLGN